MNEKTIVNKTGNDPHKFAENAETSGYTVGQREADLSLKMNAEIIKSLNIVIKHFFICSNPYIYTTVVQEVCSRDRSPEVDD